MNVRRLSKHEANCIVLLVCCLSGRSVCAQAGAHVLTPAVEDRQPSVQWTGFATSIAHGSHFTLLPDLGRLATSFCSAPSSWPSPYSYQHLGIFCKAEVKMNRWFPIPVMIRLGDVQRAEELDGKGPSREIH
jgi:hypothetical protein